MEVCYPAGSLSALAVSFGARGSTEISGACSRRGYVNRAVLTFGPDVGQMLFVTVRRP